MSKSLTLSNGLILARSSGIAQSQIVRPTESIWFAITGVSFIASRAVWTASGAEVADRHHAPSIVRLEAAHVHFVVSLCAFGEPFEFVACAVSGDEIADRAGGICSRRRVWRRSTSAQKPCRLLVGIRQFDRARPRDRCCARDSNSSRCRPFRFSCGRFSSLRPSGSVTPVSLFLAKFHAPSTAASVVPMPSGRKAYGLRLPSASGESWGKVSQGGGRRPSFTHWSQVSGEISNSAAPVSRST